MSLNSPGEAVYTLEQIYTFAKENWGILFGLLVFLGGGSALSFHVPGIIDIVKNIINAPSEIKMKKMEAEEKELAIISKRIEVYEKLKSSGIDPKKIQQPLSTLNANTQSLKAEPITLGDDSSIPPSEAEEQLLFDLENEQQ